MRLKRVFAVDTYILLRLLGFSINVMILLEQAVLPKDTP